MSEAFCDVSEEVEAACVALSAQLNCQKRVIYACLNKIDVPAWVSPEALDATRDEVRAYNEVGNLASELARQMKKLGSSDIEEFVCNAFVTAAQVERLAIEMYAARDFFQSHLDDNPRPGGRRLDAFNVAKIVLRAHRVLGRSFKTAHVGGQPSTPFGRNVSEALAIFGVRADWRRPAEAVVEDYYRRLTPYNNYIKKRFANS